MVQVITSAARSRYADVLRQMHEDRRRVFVDQLGWNLSVENGVGEVDQYDTPNAVYLIALDDRARHVGSARLLPTTGPHLLGDAFRHLCHGAAPTGDEVWEVTRFAVRPDAPDPRKVRDRLLSAIAEYGLLCGVDRYVCVSQGAFLAQLLTVGWKCSLLGPTPGEGRNRLGALSIEVTPETLRVLRARTGFRTPVLQWEALCAA